MLRALGLVVSIGLADAMNPSTIAPGLYLASGRRPRRTLSQFIVSVFGVYFVGGALVAVGPGQAVLALVPHPGHTARYIAETAAGAAMLVGAAYLWRARRRLGARELPMPDPQGKSAALLGVSIMVLELPTAFPYFAAIAAVVSSGLGLGHQLILIAIYNLCFVLPLLLMLLTLFVARDRSAEILGAARDWLQHHWPRLLAAVALLAGLFVLALGITGLAGGTHGRVGRLSRRVRRILTP